MTVHYLIEKDDDLYSAVCLELNVASQGTTIDEAKEYLQEAVGLYPEVVYETGDKEEFIPRPAPREEWLKFFANRTKNTLIISNSLISYLKI